MHPKATLLKLLKLFADYILQAIVGYVVVGLILAGGGVYLLTKIGLNWVIQIANISTPLWATIALILLSVLYTHLRAKRTQTKKGQTFLPPQVIPKQQVDILILLFKPQHQRGLTDHSISKILLLDIQTTEYHLEELEKQKMIYAHWRPPRLWVIQQTGRKYLFENKLITQPVNQGDG